MANTIGVTAARYRLSELLKRVAKGERLMLTKRGVPVAELMPPPLPTKPDPAQLIEDFIRYSKAQGRTLRGLGVRELFEEGRR